MSLPLIHLKFKLRFMSLVFVTIIRGSIGFSPSLYYSKKLRKIMSCCIKLNMMALMTQHINSFCFRYVLRTYPPLAHYSVPFSLSLLSVGMTARVS